MLIQIIPLIHKEQLEKQDLEDDVFLKKKQEVHYSSLSNSIGRHSWDRDFHALLKCYFLTTRISESVPFNEGIVILFSVTHPRNVVTSVPFLVVGITYTHSLALLSSKTSRNRFAQSSLTKLTVSPSVCVSGCSC